MVLAIWEIGLLIAYTIIAYHSFWAISIWNEPEIDVSGFKLIASMFCLAIQILVVGYFVMFVGIREIVNGISSQDFNFLQNSIKLW